MKILQFTADRAIVSALEEDINYIDAATDLLISANSESAAVLKVKATGGGSTHAGVVCGTEIAARVFKLLSEDITTDIYINDGGRVKRGDAVMRVYGSTAAILKGERTALNFLTHMSGIATYTAECVAAVPPECHTRITDTRKTLPGLRVFQKYAVTAGGGFNHRFNLSDAAMLKDNHIDAAGGITAAVTELRKQAGHMLTIEVEARTLSDVREALAVNVPVIMLDNMTPSDMTEAVKLIGGKAVTEASGNMTPARIAEVARTGVDVISIGGLTHSAPALDISLQITK